MILSQRDPDPSGIFVLTKSEIQNNFESLKEGDKELVIPCGIFG